jgi:hypothetical protein
MVVILIVPVVAVIAVIAAAVVLTPVRARRRRMSSQVLAVPASARVTPLPVRRPRITETAARFRQMSAPANVKVLADYRKARAYRLRPARVGPGLPRGARPHRPEPA